MKKRILMLGAGFMQGVAMRCARERGWEIVAIDGNPDAPCRSLADRFEPIDLKDQEAIEHFALSLKENGGLDGVFTAATDFSVSVARAAHACGLPGHSPEAARNASDKLRMRECFARAGVPSPAFTGVDRDSAPRALKFLRDRGISFPVVVKPCDNMGARGCRLVRDEADLAPAIDDAIRYSRSGFAIVEQYMEGPEYSIEALVYDGKIHLTGLADRHIFFPPYFIEMGHTIPARLSELDRRSLIETFERGIRALGLSHGAAKGDVKLTPSGAMIGEIAGRLSGGYMSGWTFPYSSGIDLTGAALDLCVGKRPSSLEPSHDWTSAERAWISIPGIVKTVSGYNDARALPYMRDVFPRAERGSRVSFPVNNVEKCGNCLACAPERELAVKAAEDACRSIVVRLEPNNPDTEAFLAGGLRGSGAFPPDAFAVPLGISFTPTVAYRLRDHAISVPSGLIDLMDTARDWQGRTIAQTIEQAVCIEPGLAAAFAADASSTIASDAARYWEALARGGLQAVLYRYDCANG